MLHLIIFLSLAIDPTYQNQKNGIFYILFYCFYVLIPK